ncbi:helicase-associated domain-containing protein [Pseudonocardia sp. HH130630-07]|uniref:helicase-associated domain-containing protein n=1 Tax=Pseudonocardia sp. HH130630-07 TaxID=1690815 RepID=UPI000814CF23|nr:helicase-associated domain-containing protein [Pseudonocardia sp. HH130630-07]ANY07131.1 DNA-binding protein [Pseudonocardia sp. HH130630-07]
MVQTSLVEWLREQDDGFLAALLRARPDLAVPPPADLTVLATRASIRASVQRACEDLGTVALTVLEALVLAGAGSGPVDGTTTERGPRWWLGAGVDGATFRAGLAPLRDLALAWGPDDGLAVIPAASEVVGQWPAGLGRDGSGVVATVALDELLAGVTSDERRVLEVLAQGPPIGRSRGASEGSGPVGALVSKGLLVRRDTETVELPRQVALALRGDRPMGRDVDVTRPDVTVRERDPKTVDGTGAGAALEFLRRVDKVLEMLGAEAPGVLRSGGFGVRELRRAAKAADTDEATAALILEILLGADLIGDTESLTPEWLPTPEADVWAAGPEESRWAVLARTWLELPRLPGVVGRRDEADKPVNALSDGPRRPPAPRDRRRILQALADLPDGTAVGSAEDLAQVLAWAAPRRGGRLRDEMVGWTVEEGTVIGVVALDAMTTAGRVLLDPATREARHPTEAAAALHAALPAPVEEILLQADLTAVAPGRLSADLAHELAVLADVESAGGATVYRFTEQSLRRALDTGRTAEDVREFLTARSRTPVPQTLTYLVDDVARRHGRLRGGAVASFLRSDEEVLLSEVLAHEGTRELGLRRIAPTVVVSALPLAEVLDGLRAAGFSPAAEDDGGAVLDLKARGRRAESRRRGANARTGGVVHDGTSVRAEELVERLRAGDALAGVRRSVAGRREATGSTGNLASLQAAVREGRTVWIGFVDAHGVAGDRVLAPTSVGGGVVEGRDIINGELRRIQLHRITAIAQVEST